jgi:hypothetical protein
MEGRLQAGFGQIYVLFLVRYTPCFWLKYTPKRRFWKTRRLIQGVLFWAYYTGRIFLWICAVLHLVLKPAYTIFEQLRRRLQLARRV